VSSSLSHALLGDDLPKLVVVVALENRPTIVFDAATQEDELRLTQWLRRSETLELLARHLGHLLDDVEAA
jgi:hypothetical protein